MDQRAGTKLTFDHSCNLASASCSSPAPPATAGSSPYFQAPHLILSVSHSGADADSEIIDSYTDNDQSSQLPPARSSEGSVKVLQHCLQPINALDHSLRACNTADVNVTLQLECDATMWHLINDAQSRAQAQVATVRPCMDHHAQAQATSCRPRMQGDIIPYTSAEEGYFVRVQSCLPPMSSALITCIAGVRARAARCKSVWKAMQLVSTVSQMVGVLLVLSLCTKEELLMRSSTVPSTSSPLPAWALGYAFGCFASLPLFCRQADQENDLELDESHSHDNSVVVAAKRLRNCIDFFFAIWFVMGIVWVFGRPSCAQASPKLYSFCVALLMLNGFRYMMPLILCCALCCCLQPRTSSISNGIDQQDGGKGRGVTQEQIDATLPAFKFKCRRPIMHTLYRNENHGNSQDTNFSRCLGKAMVPTTTTTTDQNIMDGLDCCICLKSYKENARLRGLPCSHYFHIDCVDKWLKINASCPLCKFSLKSNILHHFPFFSRWS